ncbi:MAG TPA: DNA alkylation repair protein [Fimbriimonas sp.]|nr:DNA alkylation repair protein [Fimbriimonas sp.]
MGTAPRLEEIKAKLAELPKRDVPTIRSLCKELSVRLKEEPAEGVFHLAVQLIEDGEWNLRHIAYELVAHHKPTMRSLDSVRLNELGKGIDSWYATDTFSPYLAGPAWANGQIPDGTVQQWIDSPDLWYRRAALVATISLGRRGAPGDTERVLWVCRQLVDDRDDMVVKALSWALRELTKTDSAAVASFLEEFQGRVSARAVRETRNKLRTGLKNPKRSAT